MRNFLVAVILGLLGAVHSMPVNIEMLTSTENDVLHEALVDELLLPSVTAQMPKRSPSIQASQQPSSDSASDGDPGSGQYESTTAAVTTRSSVPRANKVFEESGSGQFEDKLESTTVAKTTTYTEPSSVPRPDGKSGRRVILGPAMATATPSPAAPTASPEGGPQEVEEEIISKTSNDLLQHTPINKDSEQETGTNTPGWIVFLACLVGVAALVLVCVAVVTRERWHGPSRASQLQIKTGEEREKEMQRFLHNDTPQENGHADEYTIVPLDELPQTHTTH